MPFQIGKYPFLRTSKYLESGKLFFKDTVKVFTINYNENELSLLRMKEHPAIPHRIMDREYFVKTGKHHEGALDFVFWKMPQIQYQNPNVQMASFKNMSPSPYITCYLESGEKVLFDIDSHTCEEIMERLIKTLGKTEATLKEEAVLSEKKHNSANFGVDCNKWCLCEGYGQVPCPAVVPVPKHWRGKYHFGLVVED